MMTRTLILALSLTAASVPAAAQTESVTSVVRTDDLNLTRAADRERLDTRIQTTARRACQTGLRGAAESARYSQCVSAALASAEPQVTRAVAQAQGGTQLALLMLRTDR